MAIEQKTFRTVFGSTKSDAPVSSNNDRPKAKYWLNVGMVVDSPVEGEETRFISLPTGIPLDTQERVPTNSKNDVHRAFQSARNNLLDQLLEVAEALAPGEEKMINLQIQLRAVSEESEAIPSDVNPFVIKAALI